MTDDVDGSSPHDGRSSPDEEELARNPHARGASDPQHGAVYGAHSAEQMNSWETAKLDLSSEERIEAEQLARKGETPATHRDEAEHGANVLPMSPEQLGTERLVIRQRAKFAAGAQAVVQTVKYAAANMGAVKGARMLLQLNQTDGFDCPGCAWPDPPSGERTHAEFCENGAKAASEENTRKRIEPEFFRQHSVAELSQWAATTSGQSQTRLNPGGNSIQVWASTYPSSRSA